MRRTRFLVILAVAAAIVPAAISAQSIIVDYPSFLAPPAAWMPQGSEAGRTSFGVFTNPLDAAFTLFNVQAGAGFGSLATPYIFGGVDNMFGATPGNVSPFYTGYYQSGNMPWSAYGYFSQTGSGGDATSSSAITTPGAPYTVSGTTYNWVQQQTDSTNMPRGIATATDFVQGLVGLGAITTGGGIKLALTDNHLAANNGTSVVNHYYNPNQGTAAPNPTLDYSTTTVSTDARGALAAPSTFDLALTVPLLLKAGPITHFFSAGVEYGSSDLSNSAVVTVSAQNNPTGAGFGASESNTTEVNTASLIHIPLGYAIYLPPLIATNKKNQFIITGDTFVDINSGNYSKIATTNAYTYPGNAAARVPGLATDSRVTQTWVPGVSFKVGAGAVHSLYSEPAPGVEYGVVPAVYMDFARLVGGPYLGSQSTVTLTDTDANGNFTGPTDVSTTTTITYGNAASTTTGMATTTQFEVAFQMPMVLKIMPQGWIFGFTLATTPQAAFQHLTNDTAAMTSSQTQSVSTGGAAAVVTTTQNNATAPAVTSSNTWAFSAQHSLALNFAFGSVTMDVTLNLITVGGGNISSLLDFQNLTIQAAVPVGK